MPATVFQPEGGAQIVHLEGIVKVLQDEVKATRPASWSAVFLSDSLCDLSTEPDVKRRAVSTATNMVL